jgi:hypothetical protein
MSNKELKPKIKDNIKMLLVKITDTNSYCENSKLIKINGLEYDHSTSSDYLSFNNMNDRTDSNKQ